MSTQRVIRKSNPKTIQNKLLVGYQGWFTCAGDGDPVHPGHHGWLHWFDKPVPDGGSPGFDLFPDTTDYTAEELYPAPGVNFVGGKPASLFSSRNPRTVQRHFNWMAQHGIDGAFLQRFATQCEVDGNTTGEKADLMRLRDEILDKVRSAAEQENRVWAIMYDVSNVPADQIEHILRVDWEHLLKDKAILDSPYYLHERGMPVVALWGFGFQESHHNPESVASIVQHIKSVTPGGAYVWGGVPAHWRTLQGDMDPNPAFLDVFKNNFDAISPWTIGRYHNVDEADLFAEVIREDLKELRGLTQRIDYIPTIWPGGSAYNLSKGRTAINDSPRQGGKFLWRQLRNVKHEGTRTVYVAMFDEYDEGTAILPAIPLKRNLPGGGSFIALDADGIDNLTPDWYLRICGFAAEAMRDERRVYDDMPKKELDDYWATRPKYEPASAPSGGSGATISAPTNSPNTAAPATTSAAPAAAAGAASAEKWQVYTADDKDELPPPAYTLEDEPVATPAPAAPTVATATTATTESVSTDAPAVPVAAVTASPVTSSTHPVTTEAADAQREAERPHRTMSYNVARPSVGVGRSSSLSPGSVSAPWTPPSITQTYTPPPSVPPTASPGASDNLPLHPATGQPPIGTPYPAAGVGPGGFINPASQPASPTTTAGPVRQATFPYQRPVEQTPVVTPQATGPSYLPNDATTTYGSVSQPYTQSRPSLSSATGVASAAPGVAPPVQPPVGGALSSYYGGGDFLSTAASASSSGAPSSSTSTPYTPPPASLYNANIAATVGAPHSPPATNYGLPQHPTSTGHPVYSPPPVAGYHPPTATYSPPAAAPTAGGYVSGKWAPPPTSPSLGGGFAPPGQPHYAPPTHPSSSTTPVDPNKDKGFMKQATNVVDRYAGKETRKTVQHSLQSVAQTGAQLLGKFTSK